MTSSSSRELKLTWLESEQTGGWLSSHFDIVRQVQGAERPDDTRAYTHKLNLELDTAVALFSRLPETNWRHDVEIEGSLDYVATGLTEGCQPMVVFARVRVSHRQGTVDVAATIYDADEDTNLLRPHIQALADLRIQRIVVVARDFDLQQLAARRQAARA